MKIVKSWVNISIPLFCQIIIWKVFNSVLLIWILHIHIYTTSVFWEINVKLLKSLEQSIPWPSYFWRYNVMKKADLRQYLFFFETMFFFFLRKIFECKKCQLAQILALQVYTKRCLFSVKTMPLIFFSSVMYFSS
jgi:hypothetical protein